MKGSGIPVIRCLKLTVFLYSTSALSFEVGAKTDLLDDMVRANIAVFRVEYIDIVTTAG